MMAGKAAHMEQLAAYYTLGKPQEQVQVQPSERLAKLILLAQDRLQERRKREKARGEPTSAPLLPQD